MGLQAQDPLVTNQVLAANTYVEVISDTAPIIIMAGRQTLQTAVAAAAEIVGGITVGGAVAVGTLIGVLTPSSTQSPEDDMIPTNLNNNQGNNDNSQNGAQSPNPAPNIPQNPSDSPGKGWEWKGKGDPSDGKGNWVNDGTGQKLHPDLNHPPPKPPHWGLTNPDGSKWDFFPGKGWVKTK
jgi:hypothetical protein